MFVLYLSELFLKQTGHTKLPFIQHGSSSNDFQIKLPISQQWCLTWRLPYSGQSDFAQIVHYLLWKECVNSCDQQFHKYQQNKLQTQIRSTTSTDGNPGPCLRRTQNGAALNQLWVPKFLDNCISNSNRYNQTNKTYTVSP
jgi:hypothetical protein